VDRPLIEELTRHAYNEVNAKLPKKDRVNPA
jgi:predicted DNA-binding protein (MmcQ/YjbR family)